jgi:hypothetical protein
METGRRALFISIVALCVSIIATFTSISYYRTDLKLGVLPTLVFVYSKETGWVLRNIGSGPALNIIVAHQANDKKTLEQPTRIYPLAPGKEVEIFWVGDNPEKLGAEYYDARNEPYTSVCDEDLTVIHERKIFPTWKESDIRKAWQLQR